MSLFLILLCAGDSKRFKSKLPKPYQIINNKTILEHALNAFKHSNKIIKTVIVYNKKHKKYLKKLNLKDTIKVIGGRSRQESTFIGLKKIKNFNCKKVLIHDVARPNTSKRVIKNLIEKLINNHAVIPIIKVTDATKRIKNNFVFKNIKRDTLSLAQTPQGFTYKKIYEKHKIYSKEKFDDDASLFINNNEKVITIMGSKTNLKITDREDLELFKLLKGSKIYAGIGFDVHRLGKKRKLYLGGVRIKSKIGTIGYSDGDPVLHAIIDAILGACGMGDIGEKFSNKNIKYKNKRSTFLIKDVIHQIKLKGFSINNLDINIITETPKIQKIKKRLILNISKLCNISKNKINIKGKTTEKLGIIGKEKAIACEVIASVIKYD